MAELQYEPIIRRSWESMKQNMPLMAGLTLVYFFANIVVSFASLVVFKILFLDYFLQLFILTGYIFCLAQIREGKALSFGDFFWPFLDFNRFLHFLVYSVMQTLALFLGLLLLVVPGIYLGVYLSLGIVFFVLRRQDAVEAFKLSIVLIHGNWWRMLGFLILLGLVNVLGLLCFGIGLLVSIPLSYLALIGALEDLEGLKILKINTPAFSSTSNPRLNPLNPVDSGPLNPVSSKPLNPVSSGPLNPVSSKPPFNPVN